MALSDAFNEELHDLADAGCQVIQMEEPQIHLLAARKYVDKVINPEFMLKVFNNTVRGLRAKTEVWCHTCWGNPSQQRMFAEVQSYKPALELLNQVDADVITFEMASSGAAELEDVCKAIDDEEDCRRRDRSPHPAGRVARSGGSAGTAGAEVDSARAPDSLVGLRHGPRRHEPPPCVLQDGVARAGRQHRQERAWPADSRLARRRSRIFASADLVSQS